MAYQGHLEGTVVEMATVSVEERYADLFDDAFLRWALGTDMPVDTMDVPGDMFVMPESIDDVEPIPFYNE